MRRHTPRRLALASFQALAAAAIVPFLVRDGGEVGALLMLTPIAWTALALANVVAPSDRAERVSLAVSAGLIVFHSAITPRPTLQVLDGLELLIVCLFAVFAMPPAHTRILATAASLLYLGALVANRTGLDVWIGPVVVAMVLIATEVVLRLFEEVRRVSEHDALTGALNRAGLHARATMLRALADRSATPITVAFLDLDGFKPYNDRHGHAAGDQLLVDLVRRFQSQLRASDLVGRMGGDQFVLVLSGVMPGDAVTVMERLATDAPITFTYGMRLWNPQEEFLATVDEADRLMYAHKQERADSDPWGTA